MSIEKQLLIDYKTKLNKAVSLLSEMVCQADEDTPGEYRTRHFRECMDECIDFVNDCRANDEVRVR
tara:strand:+ start:767 stop:964 length:198 start_codon:yes stop_codon:yes gene_type:complete